MTQIILNLEIPRVTGDYGFLEIDFEPEEYQKELKEIYEKFLKKYEGSGYLKTYYFYYKKFIYKFNLYSWVEYSCYREDELNEFLI